MTEHTITCARFDELLPDWMEGTLDPATRSGAETHRRACERCAALVRDLETIVADAAALPALSPSRDLWAGVADRIDTPVVALGPGSVAAGTVGARRAGRRPPWMLGAAAAALVLLTAGVTYTVTARSLGDRQAVASREPAPPASPIAAPAETSATPAAVVAEVPSTRAERPAISTAPSVRATTAVRRRVGTRELYDREIASLNRILEERRDALDPRTAAILESNLTIIDRAIAESREALRRDPASRFLGQQLDRALDKKLELLRTAALLPART